MRDGTRAPFDPGQLPPLRAVIADYGLRARRALGQHFLHDLNLTGRIARAAGDLDGVTVVEIGPGPGGLTRSLLATDAKAVVAIERDPRCVAALADLVEAGGGRLRLVAGDALDLDPLDLSEPPVQVVANLPYNISTALLLRWLDRCAEYHGFVLMLQKEVAARLAARPGTRSYGRLSVMTQWLCESRELFDVPARAFTPPPKVTSTVLELKPRPAPLAPAEKAVLERVTAAAFGQRRKMLRSSLKTLIPDPGELLETAGLQPTLRAEQVSVEEYCALARASATLTGGTAGD